MTDTTTTPVLTGYYRYTDIWFEWFHSIESDDRFAIKAAFAHDALVHPDHPLHKEGVEGIELYMGTLQNGEVRLLFSSAQVDYIRYWLHAVNVIKSYPPLPYSDCLLTVSELRSISPVILETGSELRKILRKIDKANKRLKTGHPLSAKHHVFERVRNLWSGKIGVWCAVDFEGWDRDHSVITEFGWSLVRWEKGKEVWENGHLIVKEHEKYTNTFVANHREHYKFGESEVVTKGVFKDKICDLLSGLSGPDRKPVFLVFHDNNQDLKYLRQKDVDAPLPGLTHQIPDSNPKEGLFVVDTSDLFCALEGDDVVERRSLDRVCKHLQIPTDYLHNAGNDAHYTLLAMKSMASGGPVDVQREKRWPNRTEAVPTGTRSSKVQFQPWEEDDYSDMEGVIPPMRGYDPVTGKLLDHETI